MQLTELIGNVLAEKKLNLSRNSRNYLPKLRDIGHLSAHNRFFAAKNTDVDKVQQPFRVAIEELLHHAKFIKS